VLRERLLTRRGDASEADVGVLERLQEVAEPLAAGEIALLEPPIAPQAPRISQRIA
jgi:predicted kinase